MVGPGTAQTKKKEKDLLGWDRPHPCRAEIDPPFFGLNPTQLVGSAELIYFIIYLIIIIYIIILFKNEKIPKKKWEAFQNNSDFLACFSTNFA